MQIRDIETHHPQTIRPDCTLIEAAQMMKQMDIGALPVCEGERLVGMITDRDITVRGLGQGCNPHLTRVQQIMTRQIIYCGEDQDVKEVARLMEQKQIRRLPVLDENKRLCGIVSLGDLAVRTHDEPLAGEVLERVSEKPTEAFAT
jgi:CBS domain-containing protein